MKDERKTKAQLVSELKELRQRITELEESETQRLQSEQSLHESEERFSILSTAAFEGIGISDKGRIIDLNEQMAEMLGYGRSEMIGFTIEKFVAPESLELVLKHIQSGSEEPYEHLAMRKDGSTFPVEIRARSLPYKGHVVRVTAIRDNTERKRAEERLRLQSAALEAVANGIVITDIEGNVQWANPAFTELTGYSLDEAFGKNPRDLIKSGKQGKTFYKNMWDTILAGRVWRGELVNRRKDGSLYTEEMTITPVKDETGKIAQFVAVKQEVTERVRAEQVIRESEARYRSLFENMLNGYAYCKMIFDGDHPQDFVYLDVNQAFESLTGLPDVVGKKVSEVIPGIRETDSELFEIYGRVALTGMPEVFETYLEALNMWFSVSVYSPKSEHFVAVFDVITNRKQAEQALRESQERLAGIIDSAMDAIVTLDSNQRIILFNPAAEELFRCPADEVMGQPLDRFIPERYRKAHSRHIYKFGQTDQTSRSMGVLSPLTCLRVDGEEFPAEITISQTEMAGQKIYTAILRDATERERAKMLQESIYEIANAAVTTPSLDELYTKIQGVLHGLLPTENFFIALYDREKEILSFPYFQDAFDVAPLPAKPGRGLTEFVLRTRKPLRATREVLEELTRKGEIELVGTDSVEWLGVPLLSRGQAIGVMAVQSYDETVQFSKQDFDVMTYVSTQVASAIERVKAEQALSRRVDELSALYQTTLDIIGSRALPDLLHTIVARAVDLLEGAGGGLYLCDPEREEVLCVVSFETPEDYTGTTLAYGEGAAGTVAATGDPLIIDDYRTWEGRAKVYEEDQPFSALISVPMLWQGRVTGVIHVLHDSEKRKFSKEDLGLLSAFANQASIAVENARLFEETQQRMERLSTLRQIDQVIASSLDLRVTMNVLLGHVVQQLEVDAAAVLLYQPELQSLEFVGGRGFQTNALQFTNLHLGEGFAGRAALEQRIIQVSNLNERDTGFLRSPEFRNEGFVIYFGVPLIAKGKITGVLEIYHRQPFEPDQEWMGFLELMAGQAAIAIDNIRLFEDLQSSNLNLRQAYDATIEGWAQALEMRDMETEGHSRRAVDLTLELARSMGIEEGQLVHIRRGALLHDIGKMSVPDSILQKPGKLSDEEWEVMRQHPVYAHRWLSSIPYLHPALDIPYCHHEKWDGTGYPRGLKGEQIPLAARIFAVVDVWDALRSVRPYRKAWSQERALAYLHEQSGQHFDPRVLQAFFALLAEKGYTFDL